MQNKDVMQEQAWQEEGRGPGREQHAWEGQRWRQCQHCGWWRQKCQHCGEREPQCSCAFHPPARLLDDLLCECCGDLQCPCGQWGPSELPAPQVHRSWTTLPSFLWWLGGGQVLVVGDGDFSFAAAAVTAASLHGGDLSRLTATIEQTEVQTDKSSVRGRDTQCSSRCLAADNVARLRDRGARVSFGIDAECESSLQSMNLDFDSIIFNYPYCYGDGYRSGDEGSRELVKNFLRCAQCVLRPGGRIQLTLHVARDHVPGHGEPRQFVRWDVEGHARRVGLELVKPPHADKTSYVPRDGDGLSGWFNAGEVLCFARLGVRGV